MSCTKINTVTSLDASSNFGPAIEKSSMTKRD